MIPCQIGGRGTALQFDDGITLYLVPCSRFCLLCDTHLGPDSMDEVISYIRSRHLPDSLVIFNSHSDWDHIWGNCRCSGSPIIGHEFCRERMIERGEWDLRENRHQTRGGVRITPPQVTFSERLVLEDEGIVFRHAPGHTRDSAVCADRPGRVLFLGDLVEDPIPYLDDGDLDRYLATLEAILTDEAEILLTAHSGVAGRDLVARNMAYITAVRNGEKIDPGVFGAYARVHRWNMNQRIFLRYASLIRDRAGDQYSLTGLLDLAGDLHEADPDDLGHRLADHLSRG